MPNRLYISEENGQVRIGNELLELGFDAAGRGALASIVDKASGYQFVRDAQAPKALFRVALRRQADRELEWLEAAEARDFRWSREEGDRSMTLCLEAGQFGPNPVRVSVRVTLEAGSALSRWRMSVTGVQEAAIYQLVCPVVSGVLKVGDPVPGEALAVPRQGEGYVFHDPYPVVDGLPLRAGEGPESPWVGLGETGGLYPGGWPLQLLLYYNDQAGLYLACHDDRQNVKGFHVGPLDQWGQYPVLDISHYPTEAMGQDVEFAYDTVVGVFHGQWWEGADLYKAWARQQWWCEKKLWDRDLPEWLRRGAGIFQVQNYDIPVLDHTHPLDEIASLVNRLSAEAGIPLLALIFNFEGGGAWTGPVGFFPPREGETAFRAAMDKLRAAGNYGFVYMPGGNWYIALPSYQPPFDSWAEYDKRGRKLTLVDADGQARTGRMYDWDNAVLCPAVKGTGDLTASLVLGSIERGCPVVQIDNFPIQNARECYSADHGHPPGYGSWWADEWNRILQDVRRRARALDPDSAITTEGVSEGFIPHIDLFDQRAGNMEYFGHYSANDPMGGELIPLFSYVYGGYVGAYCAAYPECSRPEVLYWARCFGKSLAQGVIPTGGWYLADTPGLNPVTTAFWKKVARAAAQECWKYLMFGEMLKPPPIEVPRLDFSYVRLLDLVGFTSDYPRKHPERRHVVQDYAVQHGSFRAMDGTVGHIFVNVSQEVQQLDVALPAYGETADVWDVDAVVDGERRALRRGVTLPVTESVRMEPLSVLLIEVSPGAA
jgi:hypothetical protein